MARKAKQRQSFEFHGFAKRTHVRCEDCDLRGDLSTTGKPLVWIRICRCSACSGRGELPLVGLEQLDPYARKVTKPAKYMVYKPWDVECRSNRNAMATARFDAIAQIMSEPPGGENHGRRRATDQVRVGSGWSGEWVPLELEGRDNLSSKRYLPSRQRETQRAHGMSYKATRLGCPCDLCKQFRRDVKRRQRSCLDIVK